MTTPLQDKDDQWRNRRANGARPIFDPGVAPLGVDDEAGGSPAAAPTARVRLPPRLWYGGAVVLGLLLLVAGALSLA
jgi:hypothetical protein